MKHHHAAGFLRSVQYKIIAVLAFFAIITSFIFTSTSRVEADELEWPEAPELVSGAAILMDADTGAIQTKWHMHLLSTHPVHYQHSLIK